MFTNDQIEKIVDSQLGSLLSCEAKPDPLGSDYNGYFEDDYDASDATTELRSRLMEELEQWEDVEFFGVAKHDEMLKALDTYTEHFGYEWESQFGHDLALTRNHHGAGFWDRGLGEAGDVLTEWAQTLSKLHIFDEFIPEYADKWRGMFHAE